MTVHLKKLSVGSVSLDSMRDWQSRHLKAGHPLFIQRAIGLNDEELLDGGSIYWIIKGQMQARQKIDDLIELTGPDGVVRCGILLDPQIIPVWPRKEDLSRLALLRSGQHSRYFLLMRLMARPCPLNWLQSCVTSACSSALLSASPGLRC